MIEVHDLEKRYDSFVAVKNVDFSISSGEIVGLLGPNGAGKTTIMKILTCYHYPSSGSVSIKGLDVFSQALEIKRLLGYLPENAPVYPELNVREYLEFIAATRLGSGQTPSGLKAPAAIEKAVEACSLKAVWNKGVDTLSKGYRQRVGLAQAILHDPDILILDEPTSGLDPNQILEIRHLITELGKSKTILLSTHILPEVEAVCNRVMILNEGRIVAQGTTSEIANSLRGDWSCTALYKGNEAKLRTALSKHSPSATVKSSDSATLKGLLALDISSPRGGVKDLETLQEAVFDAAVEAGGKLIQLTSVPASLEAVFTRLTTAAPTEAAHE